MTIYKYPLHRAVVQQVSLPSGAQIIACQMQGGTICLWAKVTPTKGHTFREIHICGTGDDMPDVPLRHLGTMQDREFVWHVFEREERR